MGFMLTCAIPMTRNNAGQQIRSQVGLALQAVSGTTTWYVREYAWVTGDGVLQTKSTDYSLPCVYMEPFLVFVGDFWCGVLFLLSP